MGKKRFAAVAVLVLPALLAGPALPQEKKAPALKALLITGGGYHDYKALNPVLQRRLSELASVHFDVAGGLDVLKGEKFADRYDVLVYNFCFAAEKNRALIANALKATRDGKPTVLIHCAMHTFMASDDWTDLCGMRTRRHDPYRGFSVIKVARDSPVVKTLPDEWRTPGDELYLTIKLGERSTALLRGKNEKAKSEAVVCWTSTYGKGRVFATTLGHDLRTVKLPEYHRLLANGLLWACDKLGKDGRPLKGYAGPGAR
jgi:type 1 glutamine amidotransferase